MNRLSQRDVMKLRPHPGTTILFCAIKENPRRKICRAPICRLRPFNAGLAGVWRNEAIRRSAGVVALSQHEKMAPLSGPYVSAA
ncbi:hypothetical protein BCh11DRAFT_04215 [Burkholderia sp. Ch1-1]|uniref:Uncharacterized protein n=1 Tax=Paraburkholderia dioscoreae TaxID=2604047 RepID=A0A5Q4YSF5_9BURK|nr:hypothetical protein BCh11DRAFT_04215 [Burkholderia sp. Ch1-1]VVD26741.1 conserved protein of unknown function [Paraburkholderia dioscoreae]